MRSLVTGALAAAGVVVVVVVVLLVTGGSSHPYHFDLKLADADGLIQGSEITEGGVPVGTVHLSLTKNSVVLVQGNLNKSAGRVGRNAMVDIEAVNLLGQKRVELVKGDAAAEPAPSGYVIPARQITEGTDLDTVLDMLTPTVRDRLQIMLDEAGTAVAGRQANIAKLVFQLPPTISGATTVLQELMSENGTLSDLIRSSDQTITAVTAKEDNLNSLLGTLGQSAKSVAVKDTQLSATLANAPATLTSAQRFLTKLQTAVVPLGPAATEITNAAPHLDSVIKELPSFNSAIQLPLHNALAAAPALSRLSTSGEPVLDSASSTLGSFASFNATAEPVTNALNYSADNLIGTVANWSRAVEGHDNLSHIFRGGITFTPLTLDNLIDRFVGNNGASSPLPQRKSKRGSAQKGTSALTPASPGSSGSAGSGSNPAANLGGTLSSTLSNVGSGVSGVVNKVGGSVGSLLGGPSSTQSNDSSASSSASTTSTGSVSSLLNYLLKP